MSMRRNSFSANWHMMRTKLFTSLLVHIHICAWKAPNWEYWIYATWNINLTMLWKSKLYMLLDSTLFCVFQKPLFIQMNYFSNFIAYGYDGKIYLIDSTSCLVFGVNDAFPDRLDEFEYLWFIGNEDSSLILAITKHRNIQACRSITGKYYYWLSFRHNLIYRVSQKGERAPLSISASKKLGVWKKFL